MIVLRVDYFVQYLKQPIQYFDWHLSQEFEHAHQVRLRLRMNQKPIYNQQHHHLKSFPYHRLFDCRDYRDINGFRSSLRPPFVGHSREIGGFFKRDTGGEYGFFVQSPTDDL